MQVRIKEQLSTLVNLQAIESRKVTLAESLENISNRMDDLDRQLSILRQTIAEQQELALDAKKQYGALEIDLQQNQTLIKKSQNRLASVKNNREYQALLKEIEDLKAANVRTEDLMLAQLNQRELCEKKVLELQEEERGLATDAAAEKQKIKTEQRQRESDLTDLEQQWQVVSASLNKDIINKFNRLKNHRQTKGIAIVPVEDSICLGCNVNLPPQTFNELQRCDSIKFCPNCQRMIYWKQQIVED